MSYNKDTNWENEKKYLDNLSKNGDAGQKAWAESQKKVLESAQAQYAGSSGGGSNSSNVTSGSGSNGGNSQYSNYQYTIGSDRGKDKAQSMGIGTSWTNDVDGSVWTKENDGSITVNHNGVTTNNAYTPDDYSITLRQQMQAGVPYQYVQDTLSGRIDKALNTPGLEQYAYDDVYDMALKYILDAKAAEKMTNSQNQFMNWPYEYELNNSRPVQQQRDPRIDALLNEILTRDDFSYNALNDPLYQQYAQMYQREGDRAMRETMAEAAASAGGMNTYAMTAAQQAANYYNSQLGDKIPELYQLAYDMYLNDKNSKVQNLGILQNMDDTQYARYRDTMNDWYNDKNFAYGVYQDAVNQGNWQTNFDYGVTKDNLYLRNENFWKDKNFKLDETKYLDEKAEKDRDDARERLREIIANGDTPDAELIKSSEYTQEEVDLMIKKEALKKYQDIDTECANLFKIGGWAMVKPALDDAKELGLIDETAYTTLSDKYQNMK